MRILLSLLILLPGWYVSQAAFAGAGFSLDVLLQGIKSEATGTIAYTEKRYTRLRKEPVESRGTLQFVPPDKLVRSIEYPEPAQFIVDGDEVQEIRGEQVVTRQLTDNRHLLGFIEAVRATLAGDRDRLEQFYALQLNGDTSKWQLELAPKNKKLARLIKYIRISGSGNYIERIDLADTRGGSTQTVLPHPLDEASRE